MATSTSIRTLRLLGSLAVVLPGVAALGAVSAAPAGAASPVETAYVANVDNVGVFATATNTVGTPIPVSSAIPNFIAVTPNGQTAYVTNEHGTVIPIATATNTPGTPITLGGTPFGIAITPNGQTAYVTNIGSGTVVPINLATNTAGHPDHRRVGTVRHRHHP